MATLAQADSKIDCSIYHYFVWQAARVASLEKSSSEAKLVFLVPENGDTSTTQCVDEGKSSSMLGDDSAGVRDTKGLIHTAVEAQENKAPETDPLGNNNLTELTSCYSGSIAEKYRLVAKILFNEFPYIAEYDSPTLVNSIPELYSRSTNSPNAHTETIALHNKSSESHNEEMAATVDETREANHGARKGSKLVAAIETQVDTPATSTDADAVSQSARKGRKRGLTAESNCAEDSALHEIANEPTSVKRKRDCSGNDSKVAKRTRARRVPEEVKEIVSSVRKERLEAKKKVASLEAKLLKTELKLEMQQERLKEEAKLKVAQVKSRFQMKKEKLEAEKLKKKEEIKRKREEKRKEKPPPGKKLMKWEERFEQLLEFYKEYGHCKVAKSYKNPSLAEWVWEQRNYYRQKASILTKERIEKLEGISFIWNPPAPQKTFEDRIEECKEFRAVHGHLKIPLMDEKNVDGSDPTEEQKSFRLWAQSICNQYRRRSKKGLSCKLNKRMIAILEALEFDWRFDSNVKAVRDPKEDRWLDKLEQLKKIKETRGATYDKKSIEAVFPNNSTLYLWVKTQRRMYNRWMNGAKSALTAERREMLRAVDFDFEPRRHFSPSTKSNKVVENDETAEEVELVNESNDAVAEVYDDSDGNESAYL